MIDRQALGMYLNDHLAASVAALDMMERVRDSQADVSLVDEISDLKRAVESDQAVLCELIEVIGASQNSLKKSIGWVGEKLSRLKLDRASEKDSEMMLFESLDALLLGFHGRLALWNILATLKGQLKSVHDFPGMAKAVQEQIDRLQLVRVRAGQNALTESYAPVAP